MLEEWILALAASPFVYVAMYLFATIDGFFPPVPSESVVIALAAVAMSSGAPNLWIVAAVAAAGAFTGDQVAYALGRRVKVRSTRLLRGARAQRTLDWAELALTNRGASFIIGARYIPVGRVAVNMTAGAVGYPRRRFVGLTALAAVSWAIYSVAIGVGAGAWLHDRPVVAVVVGVVSGAVIGLAVDWLLGRVQGRPTARAMRRMRAAGSVVGPPSVPVVAPTARPGAAVDAASATRVTPAAVGTTPLAVPEPAGAMASPRGDRP